MSRYHTLHGIALLVSLFVLTSFSSANINVGRFDAVHIVPAPGPITIDGTLGGWDTSGEFFTYRYEEQKDKYNLRGYMMYDAANLYIAAHLGDKRILVAIVQDGKGGEEPLTMLYEPLSNRADRTPGTFKSPVSTHTFEHVGCIPARVAFRRRDGGYVLEVQLTAGQLGFTGMEMGKRFRADFGVLFSDQGGSMVMAKTLWADDSSEVSIVNDVPSESKIHPQKWGWVVLK